MQPNAGRKKITSLLFVAPVVHICPRLAELSTPVDVDSTALGMKFPATYRIDKGYVYIHTHDGADMLFKIQDSNTLVGESFFNESTYRKVISSSNKQDSEL